MIVFEEVTKAFSKERCAVQDLSFQVKKGETLVLLGQSGSGKTTALRLINRLIEPTKGKIYLDGIDLATLDPIVLRRNIGYAIQHIGLFPHMTIAENIGIVPRLLGWKEERINARVDELLLSVGLEPEIYRHQMPKQLSGGQRQRVGVARALAADPPIILMDEPFASLDPITREQLQNEFLEIQSRILKTVVFVTHDLTEAMRIGDRIALLEEGRLVKFSTPKELLNDSENGLIKAFLGKDRFQLLLHTKSLLDIKEDLKHGEKIGKILLRSSFMETLTTFKTVGSDSLSVFDGGLYIGNLTKEKFIEHLIRIL